MKPLTIGVSGINATDNPGPGVGVARSLKESGRDYRLIGLSYDVHDPGHYMTDLFDNSFMLPYPSKGWEDMQAALLSVKKNEGLDLIIPCLDAEIPLMIKHRDFFEKNAIGMLLPSSPQFELRSKDKLVDLCRKIDCLHPQTEVAASLDEVAVILRKKIEFPAIVKGKYYKAYTVYNLDAAILQASVIAAEWGFPLLVQKRVEGQEINLIGLSDKNGDIMGHVSIKKQLVTGLGKVWTAVTIRDERLDELCKRFCKKTKWQGPFELECIINEHGIYLIEINPRFPAWVYFATGVGINLPIMMMDLIVDKKCTPKFDYDLGKYLVRYSTEMVSELVYFQNLLTSQNRKGS